MGIYHKSEEAINNEILEIKKAQENPRAFSVLYDRYYKEIYLFIFKRVGDQVSTEDIASQVFVKCLVNLKKYKVKGVPFGAWLYRIAFNEVNLFYRQTKKLRYVAIDEVVVESIAQEENLSGLDPYVLASFLEKLKPKEVELLELRYFEQRSVKEVSVLLDISESNVKVKTFRLINKIKKIVEKEGSNG